MGIRETLNRHPSIAAGGAVILVVAGLITLWQTFSSSGSGVVDPSRAYFTTDDGKTWFQDSSENIPPYLKDGKEAVRVHLFRCTDGKVFAGYLERYTPESKKSIEQARAQKAVASQSPPQSSTETEARSAGAFVRTEVKKPLANGPWCSATGNYKAYSLAIQAKCADGTTDGLDPILH